MTETGTGPSLARLKRYLAADPGNWGLRAEVFDAALAAGDVATAQEQVEHARSVLPDDAGWAHRRGVLALHERRYEEAQAAFEALLARGQRDPVVRYNLGYALFAQGRADAASETLGSLLEEPEPTGDLARVYWLRCQHRLLRMEEALAAFGAWAARAPLPADAWGVASLIAFDEGHLDDARSWAARALDARPDQLEALAARGSLALADTDAPGALVWFGRALRVNPGDGRSWSGLAFAKMLGLELPAALEAFAKAVAAMPGHIGTWLGYGWCRLHSNDVEGARAAFASALDLDRNFGESHGAMAVALARLGQAEEARRESELALRLDPNGLSARYAEAVTSGEVADAEAFLRLSRRLLSQRPAGPGGRTLADVVFEARRR